MLDVEAVSQDVTVDAQAPRYEAEPLTEDDMAYVMSDAILSRPYGDYENTLKFLAKTQCGSLYAFSSLASKHFNRRSHIKLDTETMYALICDPLYALLAGENSESTALNERHMQTVYKSTYDINCTDTGYKMVGRYDEVRKICRNHRVEHTTTLSDHTKSLLKLEASKLVLSARDTLSTHGVITDEAAFKKLANDTALRLLYASFIYEVERYDTYPEDGCSLVMSLILGNKDLHQALQNYDYWAFLKELRQSLAHDHLTMKYAFIPAMMSALQNTRQLYNTLLTCLLSCAQSELAAFPEQKSFMLNVATACMNQFMHYSPKLRISVSRLLNHETLITCLTRDHLQALINEMGTGITALLSGTKIPDIYGTGNSIDNRNYGIERIMAATLVLYPGAKINGEEILLRDNKPLFINVENGKVSKDHPCLDTDSRKSNKPDVQNAAILADIRQIFSSMQEMVPHLSWDAFVTQLREICALMRSEEFAKKAQEEILSKVYKELPDAVLYDRNFSTVAYESILPRVNDIERFLQNERLIKTAKYFTKLVYDPHKEIFSASDFLRISGCMTHIDTDSPKKPVEPEGFFTAIDEHYHMFAPGLPAASRNLSTETGAQQTYALRPTPGRRQYKLANMGIKERVRITKTLSRRPLLNIVEWELCILAGAVATFGITGAVYAALTAFVPIWMAGISIIYNTILLVLACVQTSVMTRRKHLMSIDTALPRAVVQDIPSNNVMPLPSVECKSLQYKEEPCTTDDTSITCEERLPVAIEQTPVPNGFEHGSPEAPSGNIANVVTKHACVCPIRAG